MVADDPERKPVPVDDLFVKARRNSLVWSGITLLVGLGHNPSSGDDLLSDRVTVPFIGLGQVYSQRILALLFTVTAFFMLLEFMRAQRMVRLFGSRTVLDNQGKTLPTVLTSLTSRAEQATSLLAEWNGGVEQRFSQFENQVLEKMNVAKKKIEGTAPGPRQPPPEQAQTYSHEDVRSRAFKNAELAKESFMELHGWSVEARERIVESDQNKLERLQVQTEELKSAIDGLNTFHDTIHRPERIFYFWMDLSPVYLLFIIALTSTVFLFVRNPLGALIEGWLGQ